MNDRDIRVTRGRRGLWLPFLILGAVVLGFRAGCKASREGAGLPPAAGYSVPVGRLIDAWVGMWNTYDLDQVEKLFIEDARVTYFSSETEGLIRGFDAVVAHHEGFGFVRGGKDQPNRLWLEDLNQEGFGTAVVVGAIWFFRRGAEGDAAPQRGPVTFVCVRDKDEWRIAHCHFANYIEN
jgi:ketosteroid isomerase-like protein